MTGWNVEFAYWVAIEKGWNEEFAYWYDTGWPGMDLNISYVVLRIAVGIVRRWTWSHGMAESNYVLRRSARGPARFIRFFF